MYGAQFAETYPLFKLLYWNLHTFVSPYCFDYHTSYSPYLLFYDCVLRNVYIIVYFCYMLFKSLLFNNCFMENVPHLQKLGSAGQYFGLISIYYQTQSGYMDFVLS